MTTQEFVEAAYQTATGKYREIPSSTPKWANAVASANRYIAQWAREPDVDWISLYDPEYPIGTVTAQQNFDLDRKIRKFSQQEGDPVRITHLNSTRYTDYDLVKGDRLRDYANGFFAAKVGSTLRFNRAFKTTDAQFGGVITAPVFLFPKALAKERDVVPVDDPYWLVFIVAADIVRNDVTRKDLRADFVSEANQSMERMKADNDAQISNMFGDWNPLGHICD